ncbi:tetratricopeptide repeat protein [Primorskyibacter sp. S87]|uniref:tetratricopeptide repeat protein n=1 Tax=Primorskyibacter sp. S87 TaxID=3415126 RepID=UPI003C7A4CA2
MSDISHTDRTNPKSPPVLHDETPKFAAAGDAELRPEKDADAKQGAVSRGLNLLDAEAGAAAETRPSKADARTGRRPLCVCFVDVVGFSALMHEDEEGTFFRWTELREDVVIPLLRSHDGMLVKSTGDGILATFENADAALRWGRDLQIRARQRRQGLALRVSLNYCAVLQDGNDLLGDGVNIAARLQEFGAPGGVILTRAVLDRISSETEFPTRDLGALELPKLGGVVQAFELVVDGRALLQKPALPSRLPSVAVMPFSNLGGDAEDDYFASGVVEDIAALLSHQGDLTVISRSSTLAFARQDIDPKAIGEALSVGYLITGALRRHGQRIRVNAELLDTGSGQVVTSLKRDFHCEDMFELQDEIVEAALIHLLPGLRAAERRRVSRKRPSSFTAYDCYLRALDLMGSLERSEFDLARAHLDRAVTLDPEFPAPLAWAARWHSLNIGQGWSENPRKEAQEAAELARRAIKIDERNALALATYGHIQSYLFGDFETAIEYLDRARHADPSSSTAWLLSSITLSSLGRTDEAISAAERALRLSPFDQRLFVFFAFLGTVHYDAGHYSEAIQWLTRSQIENPRYTSVLRTLAVAHTAAGQPEEARQSVRRLLELEPDFSVATYRAAHRHYRDPKTADLFSDRLLEAGAPA